MSVLIIAADDARTFARRLASSLNNAALKVDTVPFSTYLQSTIYTNCSVKVICLSTSACELLKTLPTNENVRKLFVASKNTVMIVLCGENDKKDAFEKIFDNVNKLTDDSVFDATKPKEIYYAEAQIKFLLSEAEGKFVIKPDHVCVNVHEEALVIFVGETAEFKEVTVKISKGSVKADRITTNVWSFSTSGLEPSIHTIQVFADGSDQGSGRLCVQECCPTDDVSGCNLPRPGLEEYLAAFLHLDKNQFDKELADTFGNTAYSVLEKLLSHFEGEEYPTLLHFLAKDGLEACINWYEKNNPEGFKQSCMKVNSRNKTPQELAKDAHQNELIVRKLSTAKEELDEIPSPFRKALAGRPKFRSPSLPDIQMHGDKGSDDSGHSSEESVSSEPPGTRIRWSPRIQHQYDEIKDTPDSPKRKDNPYDPPWDRRPTLPPMRNSTNNTSWTTTDGSLSKSTKL